MNTPSTPSKKKASSISELFENSELLKTKPSKSKHTPSSNDASLHTQKEELPPCDYIPLPTYSVTMIRKDLNVVFDLYVDSKLAGRLTMGAIEFDEFTKLINALIKVTPSTFNAFRVHR